MKPERAAARIILAAPDGRVLLFHFVHRSGPLAGTEYWGVPGGGVDPGEAVAVAAARELYEETGMLAPDLGGVVAESSYDFRLSDGREVLARDSYFLLGITEKPTLSRAGLTEEETANLAGHRWWSLEELRDTAENIVPAELASILAAVGLV